MTVSLQADLFDDLRTATFVAWSRRRGAGTEPACLVIRAKEEHSPELYITWHTRLDERCTVKTRVDSDPAEEGRWFLSTDGEAAFYPGSVASLLRRLAAADRLLARTAPRTGPPITVEFDTRDFRRLVQPYGWVLSPVHGRTSA